MCAIEDCEPWIVERRSTPTARKPYKCCECCRMIRPGETYHKVVGMTDYTGWDTYRTCRHCTAMGEWMVAVCYGYPLEMLLEELIEHWREGYASIPFGRLIACMRLKWHDGTDPVPEGMRDLAKSMLDKAVA